MKKVFVLYICFCLVFSQSVFAIEDNNLTDSDSTLNIEEKIIESETEIVDTHDLTDGQKEKDVHNNSNHTIKTPHLSVESTKSIKKSIEINPTETNLAPDKESVCDENKEQDATQSIDVTDSEIDIVGTDLKHVPTKELSEEKQDEKAVPIINAKKIRLNEILANPDGRDSGEEFIELYNNDNIDISLENWCLHDKTEKCYNFGDVTIKSKSFLTLYNKTNFSFSLNNSNEKIYLKDANKNIVSEYSYEKSISGLSWNYDDIWYEEVPTPDAKNEESPLTKNYPEIIINELLPSPTWNENTDEFIELYNPNDTLVELKNWILKDASASGKYVFPQVTIAPHTHLTIYRSTFGFALNNSGDETVSLIAPNTKIISSISYTKIKEGLSYNYDDSLWYWELPTPDTQNNDNPLTKEYPIIYLNELLPNPSGDEKTDEFIEIYNPTNKVVSLKNWTLTDASSTSSYTFTQQEILPLSYFTVYRSDFKFALNNSGSETVTLAAPNDKPLSTVSYDETREDLSLNYSTRKWYHAQPTPDEKNVTDPRTLKYPKLLLSELLPNPSSEENINEFIEIYNPNNTKVNLKNWTLKDTSKTGSYTFTDNIFIAPHAYFVIYRKDFSFALNNSSETVSLVAPNEKLMSFISYKGANEDISYNYEYKSNKWRWSKYLTPTKKNIFNNLPTLTKFDIDKKAYKDVYVEFEARATDIDNEKLKIRWDFGDGHKSYLWETRHKYTDTGTYHGHLRIQDGSEEIIQNFTVMVKKYPKYKMKITQIVPNPTGKDSGTEFIVIKNKSKKKINLKNWSIATGSSEKTIVNHPISKKLIIKPGKSKVITKKYAAISLPNKTGIIEIRRPNGSVADAKKYGDKEISIPDNASYEKIDDVWQWIIPPNFQKIAEIDAIIVQALANEEILSQQRLEQIAAFDAVYNFREVINHKKPTQQSFLMILLQKINNMLNIVYTHSNASLFTLNSTTFFHNSHPSSIKIYNIPHTKNTCAKPFIFNDNNTTKFNFCN